MSEKLFVTERISNISRQHVKILEDSDQERTVITTDTQTYDHWPHELQIQDEQCTTRPDLYHIKRMSGAFLFFCICQHLKNVRFTELQILKV
jgi:hypothetical protein